MAKEPKSRLAMFNSKFPTIAKDRIVERNAGCWNCKHFSTEKAKTLWWSTARNATIAKGVQIAMSSPLGEQDPKVLAIRSSVPKTDIGMEQGTWGICGMAGRGGGKGADFVNATGMCHVWTGAEGASVALEGERINALPEEVLEDMKDRLIPRNDGEKN